MSVSVSVEAASRAATSAEGGLQMRGGASEPPALVAPVDETVLAGDVYLPATGTRTIDHAVATLGPWLHAYIKGLHHRPAGWALHDYTEIRARNTSQLRTLMSMTSGPIWLDETGGVLRRGHWQYRNQSAAAAARDEQFLLSLTKRYHRIARIYHYEWNGTVSAGWDSGTGSSGPGT